MTTNNLSRLINMTLTSTNACLCVCVCVDADTFSQLLTSTLSHHELELRSANSTIGSLRERLAVLETMSQEQRHADEDTSEQIRLIMDEGRGDDDDDDDGTHSDDAHLLSSVLSLPVDTPSSALIPALSSTSAPLYLRRSELTAFMIHRNVTMRKLARLENELSTERHTNSIQLKQIESQWNELSQIRQQLARLEHERQRTEEMTQRREEAQQLEQVKALKRNLCVCVVCLCVYVREIIVC